MHWAPAAAAPAPAPARPAASPETAGAGPDPAAAGRPAAGQGTLVLEPVAGPAPAAGEAPLEAARPARPAGLDDAPTARLPVVPDEAEQPPRERWGGRHSAAPEGAAEEVERDRFGRIVRRRDKDDD